MIMLPLEWRIMEMMSDLQEASPWMTVEEIAEKLELAPIDIRLTVNALYLQKFLLLSSIDYPPLYALSTPHFKAAVVREMDRRKRQLRPSTYSWGSSLYPRPLPQKTTTHTHPQGEKDMLPTSEEGRKAHVAISNLKASHLQLLHVLSEWGEEGALGRELRELVELTGPALSKLLSPLKKKGLVVGVCDGKEKRWRLTEGAKEALAPQQDSPIEPVEPPQPESAQPEPPQQSIGDVDVYRCAREVLCARGDGGTTPGKLAEILDLPVEDCTEILDEMVEDEQATRDPDAPRFHYPLAVDAYITALGKVRGILEAAQYPLTMTQLSNFCLLKLEEVAAAAQVLVGQKELVMCEGYTYTLSKYAPEAPMPDSEEERGTKEEQDSAEQSAEGADAEAQETQGEEEGEELEGEIYLQGGDDRDPDYRFEPVDLEAAATAHRETEPTAAPALFPSKARFLKRALEEFELHGHTLDGVQLGSELDDPIGLYGEILAQCLMESEEGIPYLMRACWERQARLHFTIDWCVDV